MWAAFKNIWKIKELRSRLLFTMLIIVLVRFASNIPCPGVDPQALSAFIHQLKGSSDTAGGLMSMIDIFSGGALAQFALGALGIMPYITASIIFQLLVPVVPTLEKMQREGETGRQKITQYTRYLTIVVCIIQGVMVASAMINPERLGLSAPPMPLVNAAPALFLPVAVIVLTCTTMVFMWLGEQITERGIGNGVSLIITIGIVSRLPAAVVDLIRMAWKGSTPSNQSFHMVHLVLLLTVFAAVTAATIMLTQGYRRVPIQMVRKTVGSQLTGGSTYMPLKVNFANVMPIIFAGAILMFIVPILGWFKLYSLMATFQHDGLGYNVAYGALILAFCFFWVANQFNPIQISENLKKEGAYIPGISPGKATADFLDITMTRVTLGGAIFLTALALFPSFLYANFGIPFMVTQFFGGTSLLIMVGVVLDTMRQLESHLTMKNYDGFLKSGRIRGRSGN